MTMHVKLNFFIIYKRLQEKNSSLMSTKIHLLLEHHHKVSRRLTATKRVESIFGIKDKRAKKKKKILESSFRRSMAEQCHWL